MTFYQKEAPFYFLFCLFDTYITISGYPFAREWDHCGRDRIVVGLTAAYAISAYHYWYCEFESWSWRDVQHYVIKFVSDMRQVGGFLRGSSGFLHQSNWPPRLLLIVALNTTKQTNHSHGWSGWRDKYNIENVRVILSRRIGFLLFLNARIELVSSEPRSYNLWINTLISFRLDIV